MGPPLPPMDEGIIEEEGDPIAGLSTAIADTLESNTSGIDEQLDILADVEEQLLTRAGEGDAGGVPDIEALLGGGNGGPDLGAMLGGGGGGPDMPMV